MADFMSAVVRLAGLKIPQAVLNDRLSASLERYDAAKAYAQLDAGESWIEVGIVLRHHGATLKRLHDEGAVERVVLDIAFEFNDELMSITRRIPAGILALSGESCLDIEVSVYRCSTD
jgi:hypothetical protein